MRRKAVGTLQFEQSDNEILTTSQTAKLLGVSVRTAQLLIEAGSLTSWKTPGGHRRVYRSDVLALMAKKSSATVAPSARVLIVATAERAHFLKSILAGDSGCSLDICTNVFAAASSIGARTPAVVVVDFEDEAKDQTSFLRYLASSTVAGRPKLVAVGALSPQSRDIVSRLHTHVADTQELAEAVRNALSDSTELTDLLSEVSPFPLAANEGQRLKALERSGLLTAPPEETFDQLTWLASCILKAPIALLTLLTSTHQLFKSRHGLQMEQTPRSWAFCNYTILQRDVFSVADLANDSRFASNPAVMNEPHFRFYAGAPVIDEDGFALGSLCVIDSEPRTLDAIQEKSLRILANVASDEVRLRALAAPVG
jgi:excisionase family DNA binding protein